MNIMAVFAGRFHPFHLGHVSSFKQLAEEFGIKNTLLAISGKQEHPKSPFSANDRMQMAIALGIPKQNIISVAQPYKVGEYISYLENKNLDPNDFALVFGVSKKDMEGVPEMNIPPDPRFEFKPKKDGSPSYLQPFSENQNNLSSILEHAYVTSTDVNEFPIAGEIMRDASTIRKAYIEGNNSKKIKILDDLYGSAATRIKPIFDRELVDDSSDTISTIKEYYNLIKPLLENVSTKKRLEVMKTLTEISKNVLYKKNRKKSKSIKEGDNPNYFGAGSMSPIPGTPMDLQPKPTAKKIRKQRKHERDLQKFMGH